MAIPLFVLGKQRSGTTWLANQLCEHPQIVGVRHERHHGIHESAFFSHLLGRYGDLRVRSNFIEFAEVFAASDYFQLTGLPREFLYSLWPTSYEGAFRATMDELAIRNSATYWLEKTPTHTLWVRHIAKAYPDARFIAIIRDLESVLASTVSFERTRRRLEQGVGARKRLILQSIVGWSYFAKTIRAFANESDHVMVISYESLLEDTRSTMGALCSFLEIDFSEAMLTWNYQPNSSFKKRQNREEVLTPGEKRLARLIGKLGDLMPLPLLSGGYRLKRRLGGRKCLPDWFFSPLQTDVPSPGIDKERPWSPQSQ